MGWTGNTEERAKVRSRRLSLDREPSAGVDPNSPTADYVQESTIGGNNATVDPYAANS
jgi:hypothetical protein